MEELRLWRAASGKGRMKTNREPPADLEPSPAVLRQQFRPRSAPQRASWLNRLCWFAMWGLLLVSALISLTFLGLAIENIPRLLDP